MLGQHNLAIVFGMEFSGLKEVFAFCTEAETKLSEKKKNFGVLIILRQKLWLNTSIFTSGYDSYTCWYGSIKFLNLQT